MMHIDTINISLDDQMQSPSDITKRALISYEQVQHLVPKVKQAICMLKSKIDNILFLPEEITFEFFKQKIGSLFIIDEVETDILSSYFFQTEEPIEGLVDISLSLPKEELKNKINKFVGEINNLTDDPYEELKYSLLESDINSKNLTANLLSLSKWGFITPLDILSCFSLWNIDINPFNIISFLWEESSSITNISKESVLKLVKIVEQNSCKNLGDTLHKHVKNAKSMNAKASGKAFKEKMPSFEEIAERGQKLFIRLADFIYEKKTSLFQLIHELVYNKVIDGREHQLIKQEHFYQIMENSGFILSYIDRVCIESLLKPILIDNYDVEGLRYYLRVSLL